MFAFSVGMVLFAVVSYRQFDFRVFYSAGRHLLEGQPLYPTRHELALHTRDYYVYPPLVAFCAVPLSLLPFTVAAALYVSALVLSLIGTLRILGVTDRRCYVILTLWMPVLQAIGFGTIAPLLALLLALAWVNRERPAVCGIAIAVAVAAKLFLWPLGFWLIATRRWRAAAIAIVGSTAFVFGPWALLGFHDLGWYPRALRLLVDYEEPLGFSPRALGMLMGTPQAAIIVAAVLAALLPFVLVRREDGDRRAFGAAITIALVLSPLVWIHYYVVLVVPIALAARRLSLLWVLPVVAFWPWPDNFGHWWLALGVQVVLFGAAAATFSTRGTTTGSLASSTNEREPPWSWKPQATQS